MHCMKPVDTKKRWIGSSKLGRDSRVRWEMRSPCSLRQEFISPKVPGRTRSPISTNFVIDPTSAVHAWPVARLNKNSLSSVATHLSSWEEQTKRFRNIFQSLTEETNTTGRVRLNACSY